MTKESFTHEEWEEFHRSEREFEEKWSGIQKMYCPICKEEGYEDCYCLVFE